MAEHYTANTESVTRWCEKCWRNTQHSVSGGRVGRCLEHDAPQFSKKQLAARAKQELRQPGARLGHQAVAPSTSLAPCGDPNCAGCYEIGFLGSNTVLGSGPMIRIHPPRSDY